MKILICDDSREDRDRLEEMCLRYIEQQSLDCSVKTFTNPLELDGADGDILFLDVEMPQANGLAVKENLEINSEKPLIIFETNYVEIMHKAFGRNVIGFLRKPVDYEEFCQILQRGIFLISNEKTLIFDKDKPVCTDKLVYLFIDGGYTYGILESGERTSGVLKTLTEWEDELKTVGFIRPDKKYLVNCRYIGKIKDDTILLQNGFSIKMSRRKKKACQEDYMGYLEQHARYV